MSTFWFVSAPLFGHLDWGGFLKTAQALKEQGHTVTWLSQSQIGGYLVQQGIPFIPIAETGWLWPPPPPPDPADLSPDEAMFIRYKRALDTWLSEELIKQAVNELLRVADEVGQPDVLVSDPFITASAIAAEKMGAKLAICGWPATEPLEEENLLAVQKELAVDSQQRIARLNQHFGTKGENFAIGPTPSIQSPHLHISYFSTNWYRMEQTFLPQTKFVGGEASPPQTPEPDWLKDLAAAETVLITLGSVFIGDLGFFAWAAQSAYRLGWIPIVVIGRREFSAEEKAELISALPPHTRLLNWVDYNHVMPRTRLIVHHGGMGTTHAAVLHALPQVVVPHAADQRGQAKRVSYAKVGIHLTAHDVRNGQLFDGIRAVGTDDKVRQQAYELAKEFAALGGPPRAAALLADLVK
jgi:MGT family glycosyltransferase